MKNPITKLFVPDYEKNITKTLEENLYDARKSFIAATEAKQRADATLTYITNRVDTLLKTVAEHKAVKRD